MTGEARGKAIEPLSQRFLHGIVTDLAVGDEGRVSGADGKGHETAWDLRVCPGVTDVAHLQYLRRLGGDKATFDAVS